MNPDTPNQIRKMLGTWALRYSISGADFEALAAEWAQPKESRRRRGESPTQEAVRRLCAERPGLGQPIICAAAGITDKAFYSAASKLIRSGKLYSVTVSDGRSRAYFASTADRDAWVQQHGVSVGGATTIVPPQRLAILRAAQARGATGITAADLVAERGIKRNLAHHHLSGLVEAGMLAASKHQGYSIRYFADPAHALAHAPTEADRIITGRAVEKARREGAGLRVFKPKAMAPAKPASPAPVSIQTQELASTEADYSRAVRTYGKPLTFNRLQDTAALPPDPRYPSFSSMRLGSSLVGQGG